MATARPNIRTYLRLGGMFVRDHPQIWTTALVALVICGAFVGMSLRFAGIARDAQEQLFNDRAGWLLDGVVEFAPDVLEDSDIIVARLGAIRAQNETIEEIRILAPHGSTEWRTYVTDTGRGGSVSTLDPLSDMLVRSAWAKPGQAYTAATGEGDERTFTTTRALVDDRGEVTAVVLMRLRLSEADRLISRDLTVSMALLAVILIAITALLLRHARIVDFATLYKKQIEIDQMKDSFLGMASHELKSPLAVIRGYIEYLREGTLDEATRAEYLRRVEVSADELRALVDDILDVSRIEMGRLRFTLEQFPAYEVLDEVAGMFKDAAMKKGLLLTVEHDPNARSAYVHVDRGRLKQVVVNLVSNAVKYTPTGAVTLRTDLMDNMVELSVKDTGMGMSAEAQKKLFNKFYRIESEETKAVTGTGLGLWITKYIVEQMQGTIGVESIKGEGSRFVVRFPKSEQGDLAT